MRWFKHLTCAHKDEKLSELIASDGLEAYGFWWSLLEVVAEQMDKNSAKCSASYPLNQWARLLYCHHHTVSKYMGKLGVTGIVTVGYETSNGISKLKVTIPNLLKYRDEYSKKSRHAPDKLPPKNIDTDTDTEIDNKKTLAPKPRKPRVPSGDQQLFIAWWMMAYEKTMDAHYVMSSKDGKHVKEMLVSLKVNEMLSRAAMFFISEDDFYKDKKDISFFRSQVNKIPKANGEHLPQLREKGIIPPEGVKLQDWHFWELPA